MNSRSALSESLDSVTEGQGHGRAARLVSNLQKPVKSPKELASELLSTLFPVLARPESKNSPSTFEEFSTQAFTRSPHLDSKAVLAANKTALKAGHSG